MHHLHHDEGIAVTDTPRVLSEVRHELLGKPGWSQRPNECDGIAASEGSHGQSHERAVLIELVERLSENSDVPQLFLAYGGHQQKRDLLQPPAEESQEANAHLVGPMDILQHDNQWLPSREALEELADRLEREAWVSTTFARGLLALGGRPGPQAIRELGQEPFQLVPPARLEPLEDLSFLEDAAGA